MTSRKYTGNKDGPATAPRKGTTVFKDYCVFLFDVNNLGIYANRPMVGNPSKTPVLSVHSTWRAVDLGGTKEQRYKLIDFLYTHRDILGIEEIHDYAGTYKANPKGWGAGYRCDRDAWKVYDKNTIGSKGGQWVHVEISPLLADHPDVVRHAFATILGA